MWKYLLGLFFCFFVLSSVEAQSFPSANSFASNDLEVKAYPNPAVNEFTLEILNSEQKDYKLVIYNILGRELKQIYLPQNGNTHKIDISSLKKGVYLFRIFNKSGKTLVTRRMVVNS